MANEIKIPFEVLRKLIDPEILIYCLISGIPITQFYNNINELYNKRTRGIQRKNGSLRRAAKINRTPKWLSKDQLQEIELIYRNCPEGYTVDHIVPLRGKNISGLHVPWNLQYLTKSENSKKSNKF